MPGRSLSVAKSAENLLESDINNLIITFVIPIFHAILFPNSPIKNYEYRRFIKNRAPTRRDEGEYPLWVFD